MSLSLLVEELSTMSSKEDNSSRTWICDRCLAISSSIQELLRTVKILSDRIQLLEDANADLSTRHQNVATWKTSRVTLMKKLAQMRTKLQLKIKPKNVAMAHTRPQRKPKVPKEVPKSQWGALNPKL